MNTDQLIQKLNDALNSESSGRGISYYTKGVICPKFVQLGQKYGDVQDTRENDTSKLDIGLIFHKLQELYHSGELGTLTIEDRDVNTTLAIQAGLKLFLFYRAHFDPNFWGVPYAVEQAYKDVGAMWGVKEFTFRPDLVVRVSIEDSVRISARYPHIIMDPGLWIIDWKTASAKDVRAKEKYENSVQFAAYCATLQSLLPDEDIRGLLAVRVINHKEPTLFDKYNEPHSVQPFAVRAPDAQRIEEVRSWLQWAEKEIATGEPRLHNCVTYTGICPFLQQGLCDRRF